MRVHGAEMDTDNNKSISCAELIADAKLAFAAHDANGNGFITATERNSSREILGKAAFAGLIDRHFTEIDKNSDDSVSWPEMQATATFIFNSADQNHDHQVSKTEWTTAPAARLRKR